jgi:trimethylamine-N-oxide reductase (cytochrome c)
MNRTEIDIKDKNRYLKGTSLMGQEGGPISNVDSHDGKLVRIRPYHYDEDRDFESLQPWKIEARGKEFGPPRKTLVSCMGQAYKKRVYSKNRVSYPLKRADWDPKGERNPQNRGKSKYVPISWDEAARLIADELLRVRDTYGPEAVLAEADMHAEGKHIHPSHASMTRLLSMLGGYTIQMRNQDSWEGWFWGAKNVWGCEGVGEMTPMANLYPDIAKHSEMLLFWGCDPETTPNAIGGYMASRLCYYLSDLGIKSVYVCPDLNYGAAVHGDKWIPVLPCTDAALYLGIAHVWLSEGIYDREYVESHAVGYEEFFDYVLGKEDGEAKTPAWAAEKCGVSEWTIKALARAWAKKVTSQIIGNGGGNIRGPYATEPARLAAILLGMQGLGKPGRHQAKMLEWNLESQYYPVPYQSKYQLRLPIFAEICRPTDLTLQQDIVPDAATAAQALYKPPTGVVEKEDKQSPEQEIELGKFATRNRTMLTHSEKLLKLLEPMDQGPKQVIPRCLVSKAILEGKADWWGLLSFCGPKSQQWLHFNYPAKDCSEVHMIWTDAPCNVTCWNDGFRFVKAARDPKIECIVAQHMWLENDCLLADIVLPIVTQIEMEDLVEDVGGGTFQALYRTHTACTPVDESVSDFEAVAKVAEKLGKEYYDAYTQNKSPEELCELFYHGTGLQEEISYEDFKAQGGIYVSPPDPSVKEIPAGLYEFYKDPEKHPLATPSGKLEFTSSDLKRHFPDDPERPPFPKWIENGEYHDERISSERAKKYPLLCMSNHGHWRMHAQCDDITWNREVETMKIRAKDGYQYEPVWLNTRTAAERGIKHRDIVKVFNERGVVLCAAYVTERVMRGVAYIDHGARFDPIDAESIDRGGAINLITPGNVTSKHATGMVVTGFLVEVQGVTDEEMNDWKTRYPEAFARKIDADCGVCLEGWLAE